jgi:hypothetical protein
MLSKVAVGIFKTFKTTSAFYNVGFITQSEIFKLKFWNYSSNFVIIIYYESAGSDSIIPSSVADPGCFIPDPDLSICASRIPDLGSRILVLCKKGVAKVNITFSCC